MKLTKTCARFLRKHGGTILAVAASVGVVATAIETGKATMHNMFRGTDLGLAAMSMPNLVCTGMSRCWMWHRCTHTRRSP